ncbi:hypothetical protein GCM10009754_83940 [Amycolatopsis minnesotensis]|uniref:Transposase n=1 Tax=Amycolatopsis minnesotensis TaxID=337894 RepID=A0ABN2STF5_9PSEU
MPFGASESPKGTFRTSQAPVGAALVRVKAEIGALRSLKVTFGESDAAILPLARVIATGRMPQKSR